MEKENRRKAIVVGAGIGGLSAAIRLQSAGFDTTVFDSLPVAGGRGAVRKVDGFTFDMGPTVLTVPHFIEELFACRPGQPQTDAPDFPAHVRDPSCRVTQGISGGPETSKYVRIIPILPYYRIYFDDGTWFDYDGDSAHARAQIEQLAPEDLAGYDRFYEKAQAIFERGFLELGYTYFESPLDMIRVVPDLFRLDAVRPLFSLVSSCFSHPKTRQIFSFQPLLVGGNPLRVPGIYAMIHFVEKHWGIHFAMGGTGALVSALVRKFEELGGSMRLGAEVKRIVIDPSSRAVRGVESADGVFHPAEVVVSNGDYVHTFRHLIDKRFRPHHSDAKLKRVRQSMSVLVVYFGFRADGLKLDLRHHNIILAPRYEPLLKEIFDERSLPSDFSQYLHIPTLTDPSLAPAGHHTAYTLVPVPNLKGAINWAVEGPRLADTVIRFLDERGYIPGLQERIVTRFHITPTYFSEALLSDQGNAFGLEPRLAQSAWFRPHNRCRDIHGLYLVGANTQPGGGTPSVMMSAKMTVRAVLEDFPRSQWADSRPGVSRAGASASVSMDEIRPSEQMDGGVTQKKHQGGVEESLADR